MVDKRTDTPHQPIPEPSGIVSVNSRGGTSNGMFAKFALTVLVILVLAIGSLYTFNSYRTSNKGGAQAANLDPTKEPSPPAIGRRRVFEIDAQAKATPPTLPTPSSSICPDGAVPQFVAGPDGKPQLTPAGLPQFACIPNKVVVPALESMPTAKINPIDLSAGVGTDPLTTVPVPNRASRYAGDVILPQASQHTSVDPAPSIQPGMQGVPNAPNDPALAQSQQGPVQKLLRTTPTPAATASMIGDRDMILPQGRSIDCNLTVRLVSDVSGHATCVLSSDVYSDSGRVVLAERGSIATGDYIAQMAQGQRRLFVVWTRLQTPKGVIININSPAADALGGTGLPGYVDNRWGERIGAAFLLSLVEDAIGYETAKTASQNGGGAAQGIAVFQNSTRTGQSMAERILDSTINIKPTLYKNQGDRATIFVSQDLDFGAVYALRAK